jgi:hypothetical protein
LNRALRLTPALAAAVLCALLPAPSGAAWQPGGVPLSPMPVGLQQYLLGLHQDPRGHGLVADGSNGAYVVWQLSDPLPDLSDVRYTLAAQRVDVLGNRPTPWPAGGSPIHTWLGGSSFGTFDMDPLGLFPDGGGGAIAAMIDQTFLVEPMALLRFYAIAPGGAVQPIHIANSSFGGYPFLVSAADGDGAGGAVMVWLERTFAQPPDPPAPGSLFAQRIDASGAPLWSGGAPGAPGVELNAPGLTAIAGVAALSDGGGGAFFAWLDQREPAADLYVQHIHAAGVVAPGWPAEGVIVCSAPGERYSPYLTLDGAGGVVVVWRDERSGAMRVFAHRVRADGILAPGIPADGRQLPSGDLSDVLANLASDGQGGCFVARYGQTPSFDKFSRLHRLDASLQPRPGWPAEGIALNPVAAATGAVGLAPDGSGGAFVTFRNGNGAVAPEGLYAQHFASDGSVAPGWSGSGHLLSATGQYSEIVRSGSGAIAAWSDSAVYAQRIVPDGPVAVQLALVRAVADAGRVTLRWYSADGPWLDARLERNAGGTGWTHLAEITADGEGHFDYQDAAVMPGARYGYRLVWRDGEITRTGGEAWIIVPALSLGLEAPSPNPSSGPVALSVTLPDAREARLDVLDLAGRRVAGRAIGALGAGRHTVVLAEAARLPVGLYVVQLTQGGAARRVRFARVE